jgi:5'-3' exonuclease
MIFYTPYLLYSARDLAESHAEALSKGVVKASSDIFDSNCITPGTEFMNDVATHLT